LDLAIIIPTVTAVLAGLIGFITSAYVGYLNNNGTLEVEREKERAAAALETQKFKTNLILEAVKTGDRQKALDNLTFFLDAGFLDDPDDRIKKLITKNIFPVLPTTQEVEKLRQDLGISTNAMQNLLSVIRDSNIPPDKMREKLREVADRYVALRTQVSDLNRDIGDSKYKTALVDAINNGNLSAAKEILGAMTAEQTERLGSNSIALAKSYEEEGEIGFLHSHFDDALSNYQKAYEIYQKTLPKDHPKLFEIRNKVQQSSQKR
jgi:hypothetical protein